MKIAVFGIGYVGAVSAACLSDEGHEVVCVDTNADKVDDLNAARPPIIEPGIEALVQRNVADGRLRGTTDAADAVAASELVLVCVGTPSRSNGDLDLTFIRRVSDDIGAALRAAPGFVSVVFRSTMLPGTTRGEVIPRLEAASGRRAGEDFGVCFYPEFLREGCAVADFKAPPKVVFAATDDLSADRLRELNAGLNCEIFPVGFETAEMVKYADNTWHALKVAFANEIGSLSRSLDVDGRRVMEVFCKDTKLNISPNYLRPGFAFGGSCLPKDVRALNYSARKRDLSLPLIASILPSNEQHIERALETIRAAGHVRIGVLGLSFKADTDDLRESPMVTVVERLIGKGHEVRIFDDNVRLSQLVGANRSYVYEHLPHIARLMAPTWQEVLEHGETIIVGNEDGTLVPALEALGPEHVVIDLTSRRKPLPAAPSLKEQAGR